MQGVGDCLLRRAASSEQLDGLFHSGAMQGRRDLQSPACGPHEGFPPLRMDELLKAGSMQTAKFQRLLGPQQSVPLCPVREPDSS